MDTSDVQGELPSTSSNGEHQQFTRVNSILKKLKEQEYESIFKSSKITDDALDYINSKEEMRNILKDEKIPTGVAIKFTSIWFSSKTQATAANENASSETESHETSGADIAGISMTKREEHKSLEQDVLEIKSKNETSEKNSQKSSVQDKQKTGRESVTEDTESLATDVNSNTITKDKSDETSHTNTGTSSSDEKQQNNLQDYKSEKTTMAEETALPPLNAVTQPKASIKDHPKKTPNKTEDTSSAHEKKTDCDNGNGKTDSSIEVKKPFCPRKPFGTPVGSFHYSKGNCFMVEENKEIEFKALTNECPDKLRWKIMQKATPFICGILNAGAGEGTIYFGIGDSYDKTSNFSRGEIIGLEVEELKDEISKAFQSTLDDHIRSDNGEMKKGGDMNCVNIHFVPVTESAERTGRYVIEIEIKREWKFCKDHVYYPPQWTEKRGTTSKTGLHDLYKINKDKWEDPTIRTCGSTIPVKNVNIDKQIKEPLSLKYKEWQVNDEANRRQLKRIPSYDAGESIDVQKFSTDIRESLREINFKEISYILIANKVPPEYRGSNSLAFLQSIPWIAVFDLFDQNSKKDGLHFIFNETSDSARATVKELGDFKDLKPSEDMSTRGTTWILRSQSMHESDWTENSNHCLYRAVSAYHEQSPTDRIHCVFLVLSNEYLQEMANIIESCFSIIGNNANKCITIMSEKKKVGGEITKLLKPDVRRNAKAPCSIFGFPLDLLKENVREMLGPIQFEEPGATTDLPHLNGKTRPVLNKRLNSLTDLEVYSPKPKLANSCKEIERAKEDFYKGDVIKQLNLFHVHDIERTHKTELTNRIDKCLKRLSDPSEVVTRHVETVTLSYESGSGATTLCRRILWDKRHTYRCAVVKTIGTNTDYQIDELQRLLYETSSSFIPPVLVLLQSLTK